MEYQEHLVVVEFVDISYNKKEEDAIVYLKKMSIFIGLEHKWQND